MIRRPFVLEEGPLVRLLLVRLREREHLLFIAVHHIVTDGWSHQVLLREMGQLYRAFTRGRPSPLPELEIQYADYAVWQRRWLSGDQLSSLLEHWKGKLAGAPHLELPTDRPRPPVQSFRGALRTSKLPGQVVAALRSLSQERGVTFFTTLLAGFEVLLRTHTGQDDLVVGIPVAGRRQREVEGLIGFFINSLPLRLGGSGSAGRRSRDPAFAEVLEEARKTLLEA